MNGPFILAAILGLFGISLVLWDLWDMNRKHRAWVRRMEREIARLKKAQDGDQQPTQGGRCSDE